MHLYSSLLVTCTIMIAVATHWKVYLLRTFPTLFDGFFETDTCLGSIINGPFKCAHSVSYSFDFSVGAAFTNK